MDSLPCKHSIFAYSKTTNRERHLGGWLLKLVVLRFKFYQKEKSE
jgi:hypothetical protein